MGAIISKFRGQLTTKERLTKIRDEIREIEEYKWSTLKKQKHLIGLLVFSSVFLYVIVALVFYFYYLPRSPNLSQKLLYSLPLFIFPFIVWGLRQALSFYYRWIIDTKEDRLKELKKERERVLDKVMETETYKVAMEIFKEFAPERLQRDEQQRAPPPNTRASLPGPVPDLRNRFHNALPQDNPMVQRMISQRQSLGGPVRGPMNAQPLGPSAGGPIRPPPGPAMRSPSPMVSPMRFPNAMYGPPRQLARPILPTDRGVFEKLVDYVVGDGPSNRYALICKACCSHNGMALKDDFEYLSFKCCYCGFFNPARKQRPIAPQLPPPRPPSEISQASEDDTRKDEPSSSRPDESGPEIKEINNEAIHEESVQESGDESISASEDGSKELLPGLSQDQTEISENQEVRTSEASEGPELIDADEKTEDE